MKKKTRGDDLFREIYKKCDFKIFWDKELGNNIVKRNGKNWMAYSPFREDKKASFSICVAGPKAGTYNDFGDEGGDWATFLEKKHSLNPYGALTYMIEKYVQELLPSLKQSPEESIPRMSEEDMDKTRKAFAPKNVTAAALDTAATPTAIATTDATNIDIAKVDTADGNNKETETETITYRTTINEEYDKIISKTFQDAFWSDPEAVKFQTQVRKHGEAVLKQVGIGKISPEIINALRKKVPEEYLFERGFLKQGNNGPDLEPFLWFDAFCYEHLVGGQSSHFTTKPFDKKYPPLMISKEGHWLENCHFLNGDCILKIHKIKDLNQPLWVVEGQNDYISVVEHFKTEYVICTIGSLSAEQKKVIATLILDGFNVKLAFDNDKAGREYLQSIGQELVKLSEAEKSKNPKETHIPQLTFLRYFPKTKNKDGVTSECKDIDDALKLVSAQEVINGFITLDLFCYHDSIFSTKILPTLEKLKDKVEDGKLHEIYNFDDNSVGIAYAGVMHFKKYDVSIFDILTNFTGQVVEIITTRIWEFSRELKRIEFVLSINHEGRSIIERLSEDDFQDKKKLQAFLCRHLQNPLFQSKQIEIIRGYLRSSNPHPVIKNLTQQLGWDAAKKIYYTRTAKVHGDGSIEPIDDHLLYTKNESIENRKYIKILPLERYQEVGSFVFKELLYIHDPVLVVLAISIVIGAWIKSFLLERFGKMTIFAFVGITSSGKTVVATIANALDGNPQAFLSFNATANAVMRDAALLVDHLLLVDDAKSENMSDESEKGWLRFLQGFYDGLGRARMTDTTRLDGRCGLLITGENSLKLQSSLGGRIFEIPIIPYGQVENCHDIKAIYAKHLHFRDDFCGLKASIIKFMLARGINQILSKITTYASEFENCTEKTNNVARLAHAAGELQTLSEIFLDFGVEERFCDQLRANELKIKINKYLKERVIQQADEVEKLSISTVFVNAIQSMLASGKYGFQSDSPNDMLDKNSPIILGRMDENYIYILPEVSISEVRKVLAHSPLRITAKNVSTSLQEDGIISEGATEKQFHYKKANYWKFNRSTFREEATEKKAKEKEEKLTTVDPSKWNFKRSDDEF